MEMVTRFPKQCQCGSHTIILTSKTKENPGRRFYRCGDNSGPGHTFKWVDDATTEELGLLASQLGTMKEDIAELKQEVLDIKNMREVVYVLETIRSAI
ncbi:hypothetical protein N665_0420s0025 [Sinapis alba]|nr:hypothetical protein N665_0420s0025 [Sinapis alba]